MYTAGQPQPLRKSWLFVLIFPCSLLILMLLFAKISSEAAFAMSFASLTLAFNFAGYNSARSIALKTIKRRRAVSSLAGIFVVVGATGWGLLTFFCFANERSGFVFSGALAENLWKVPIVISFLSLPGVLSTLWVWNRFRGAENGITLWDDTVIPPAKKFTINPFRQNRIDVVTTGWLSKTCLVQFKDAEYEIALSAEAELSSQESIWYTHIEEQTLRDEAAGFLLTECQRRLRDLNFGEAYLDQPEFEGMDRTLETSGVKLHWDGNIRVTHPYYRGSHDEYPW